MHLSRFISFYESTLNYYFKMQVLKTSDGKYCNVILYDDIFVLPSCKIISFKHRRKVYLLTSEI